MSHVHAGLRVAIITKATSGTFEVKELVRALSEMGFEVQIYHPDRFGVQIHTRSLVTYQGGPFTPPHLVLARTGAGTEPRTIVVLRELERMGVPVVNRLEAIRMAMDKVWTMQQAAADGLLIPRTAVLSSKEDAAAAWRGRPLVIKPASGSKGRGAVLVETESSLRAQVDLIHTLAPERTFLIQDWLGDEPSTDIRVFVLGFKAIAAMKRRSRNGDFRANFSQGGEVELFPLTPEVVQISERICRSFGVEIGGVDLLKTGTTYAVCEINGSPGFRGLTLASGLDIAAIIARYVAERLRRHLAGL